MKRREILKYAALMTGAAISAPLILSLESCKSDPSTLTGEKKLQFFNEDQFSLVKSIADTVLPKTDSPSATEVGVHYQIDQMVGKVYKKEDQETYSKEFSKLIEYLNNESSEKEFQNLSETERLEILRNLSSSSDASLTDAKNGFLAIKQQTIVYYLNTEEVATNYLNYLPVPGQYDGCITLESVGGKAWAI